MVPEAHTVQNTTMHQTVRRNLLFDAALAVLLLRALTPDGYMPATQGSGLLFELCPDGVPAGFMHSLGGGHHHHHSDDSTVSGSEQCPIGHMLASAFAIDIDAPVDAAPAAALPVPFTSISSWRQQTANYRSRAPPA